MRIRTLIERRHDGVTYRSGDVLDVPGDIARAWAGDGTAEIEGISAGRSFEIMKSFSTEELAAMSADELRDLHLARSGRMTAKEPDVDQAIASGADPANEPKPEVAEEADEAEQAAADSVDGGDARKTTKRGGARAETTATKSAEKRS